MGRLPPVEFRTKDADAMRSNSTVITRLADLVDGQEAVCFAVLARKTLGVTRANQQYMRCLFKDKQTSLEAPLWHDDPRLDAAKSWVEGIAYRAIE